MLVPRIQWLLPFVQRGDNNPRKTTAFGGTSLRYAGQRLRTQIIAKAGPPPLAGLRYAMQVGSPPWKAFPNRSLGTSSTIIETLKQVQGDIGSGIFHTSLFFARQY